MSVSSSVAVLLLRNCASLSLGVSGLPCSSVLTLMALSPLLILPHSVVGPVRFLVVFVMGLFVLYSFLKNRWIYIQPRIHIGMLYAGWLYD